MLMFSVIHLIRRTVMDINLEKIELVKDRTGVTYAEAKAALEKAEGSVVDAIIDIEEEMNKAHDAIDGGSLKDSPLFAKMKEIVDKGNVTKILVRKNDKTIVNFPVTAGVIGAVLVPWGAILGIAAALGTKCDIEFVDKDGNLLDINGTVIDRVGDSIEDIAFKTSDRLQELGDKGSARVNEAIDKFNESGAKDTIKEAVVTGGARLIGLKDKIEKSGKLDEVKEAAMKAAKKAADTARELAREAEERAEQDEEEK